MINKLFKFKIYRKNRSWPERNHYYNQWVLWWRFGPIFGIYDYPSQTSFVVFVKRSAKNLWTRFKAQGKTWNKERWQR